jgi:hypothetical protein
MLFDFPIIVSFGIRVRPHIAASDYHPKTANLNLHLKLFHNASYTA